MFDCVVVEAFPLDGHPHCVYDLPGLIVNYLFIEGNVLDSAGGFWLCGCGLGDGDLAGYCSSLDNP